MNVNATTAGFQVESVCGRLYDYGRKVESGETVDATMFFRWWAAPDDCDYRDPAMWPLANPSYGVTVQPAFYQDELTKRRESEFRRYYLNQWVATEETWLPFGAWDACVMRPCELVAGAPTFIGWDASTRYDSTAIVTVQRVNGKLRAHAKIWQRPLGSDGSPVEDWHIPGAEVREYVRQQWRTYQAAGIAFDPAFITWEAQELANEGAPMLEWPQTDTRMVPATQTTYEAIVRGVLEHDGNPAFARHVANAAAVQTNRGGQRLTKGRVRRHNQIDAAVALCMAVDQAMRHADTTSIYETRGLLTI